MPAYLLGTQALAGLVRNAPDDPVRAWAARVGIADDEIVASVVSFLLIKRKVQNLASGERSDWELRFGQAVHRFREVNGLMQVTLDIATRAAELSAIEMPMGAPGEPGSLGDLGLLVLATALDGDLMLVDRRQPYHRVLEDRQRLELVDPYL